MNYQRAIVKTFHTAAAENQLMFLYWNGKEWLVTNHYEKGWLFRSYPGGRNEFSQAGKDLLDHVEAAAKDGTK